MVTRSKLTVILHADVVGSTALVQLDESLAHDRIRASFLRFSEIISTHGGTPREIRGDALVADFSRGSDCVRAALEFQAENTTRSDSLADGLVPVLRIGIAMGEVVIADDTITGAGVVLAQRLEQLARSGGVCLQGAVRETLPRRMPWRFDNLGEHLLKGFDEPVRVFTVEPGLKGGNRPESNIGSRPGTVDAEEPEALSVAVLPFLNMSGQANQDHIGDGIAEDLATALSKIARLLVMGRHSTAIYKGKQVDVRQVGRELGVHNVLDGSVRRSGNRVRITAQLIDTVTGHQRWGERYDRTLDDMFAVQDDITRRVTVELQVQLTEGEQARVWSRGTSDFEAWENAVRGAAMLSRQLRDETRRARELSEAALRADPCFPSAWMVRGWALYQQFTNGWSDEPEQTLALAIEAGNRALELDPSHADSLCLLGVLRCVQGDFPGALVLMEQAVGLAPHNAWILALSANVLAFAGRSHGAVPRIQRAIELSPIHPLWFVTILGNCHFQAGDFDLAVGAFERAVARSPGSMVPRIYLVYALVGQRSLEEARAAAQAVLDMKPDFSIAEWERRFPYRHAPVFETLRTSLRIAGLPT